MTEPQMGLTYAEQLAVVQRAEASGFETFFRSDHYESFPGESDQPTTDAWAVLAGLAGDVPHAGQLRQARRHRRRDERRADRGWRRGRLARGGAPPSRVPVPGDRGAGRHAGGDARDPARPVGGTRRLVVPRRALLDRRLVLPPEARIAAGSRGSADPDPHRWPGIAPRLPDRSPPRGRV